MWTPDGSAIIFSGGDEDRRGVYRKPVNGGEAVFLAGNGEAVPTDASRDGTLVFSMGEQTAERAIWTLALNNRKTVDILATPALEHQAMFSPLGPGAMPSRSRVLFPAERFRFSGNSPAFDVHPDGKRFVMVTRGDPPPAIPDQINVVLDWFEELKRRAPAGR